MPRGLVSTFAVIGSLAAACGGGSSSAVSRDRGSVGYVAASCAAPVLAVAPVSVRPGGTAQASGKWFAADCYDTGQPGSPPPLTDLTIQVTQGERSWAVATGIDASGTDYTFKIAIQLPVELHAGPAEVAVKDYGRPVALHVKS